MKRRKKFVYRPQPDDKLKSRLETHEIDEAISTRKMSLGDLLRLGAPRTEEQREALAAMADRLMMPKKRGRPRGSASSPKHDAERMIVAIVRRERNRLKRVNGKALTPGDLDKMIDRVCNDLADIGAFHGLGIDESQAELMRADIRGALTHGKRDKARTF
jgi:hypothetical protein